MIGIQSLTSSTLGHTILGEDAKFLKKVPNYNTSEIEGWVYYAYWKFDNYGPVICFLTSKIVASTNLLYYHHFCVLSRIKC
mmetsp:Transcript_28986/g.31185  ORF Transcript_28986/g.31185 Transcript_28986/m.31185 type:complete len:81 (-) Transcript_28986:89-331(-)